MSTIKIDDITMKDLNENIQSYKDFLKHIQEKQLKILKHLEIHCPLKEIPH